MWLWFASQNVFTSLKELWQFISISFWMQTAIWYILQPIQCKVWLKKITVHLTADQCYEKSNLSEKEKSNIKELQKEKIKKHYYKFSTTFNHFLSKISRKPENIDREPINQHQCNHSTFQYLSVKLYSNPFLLLLSSNSSSFSTLKITGWLYRQYLIYAAPKSSQPG